VLGVVCCAAGGVEAVRCELVEPLLAEGWVVGVTATPTAYRWLADLGEVVRIEAATGLVCRAESRLPHENRPHPDPDCFAVVPASANTVAKLALGIADNQATTQVCEALGNRLPVVVAPRASAGLRQHPAWAVHLETLRAAGAVLVGGGEGPVPWDDVRAAVRAAVPSA
jgi:phosphopantothenoylcysteine synthetase/decarboxylase